MNISVFSTNLNFFKPVADALTKRGHRLSYFKETGDPKEDGYQMGLLMQWGDAYYVEFCQTPFQEVIDRNKNFQKPLFARMHRIEVYSGMVMDPKFPWDKVNVLFVSAEHVLDRFILRRASKSKPKECVIAKTNTVNTDMFKFKERTWHYPIRLCMVGNFVPKKRQYSLIETMFDVEVMFPGKFKLDIVGQRGVWGGYGNPEYFDNCTDLIEDRKLKDIVTIYEVLPPDKVAEFLYDEHVIISNSNEEGTHVSIAEGICTGCLAFVHNWRGASQVYPPSVALHFNSDGEFVDLCDQLNTWMELGQVKTEVKSRSDEAVKKYGDLSIYDRMAKIIEDTVANENKIKAEKQIKTTQSKAETTVQSKSETATK